MSGTIFDNKKYVFSKNKFQGYRKKMYVLDNDRHTIQENQCKTYFSTTESTVIKN